uniref:F-box domain-containing protein n=1 Tax=Ascaris lumbricoides TaxID=6252 RepID=A0A9J2P1N5_ASCLU
MTAIFDMTRRVTMYDSEEGNLKHKIEQDELGPPISATTSSYTIEKLPDKVLQQIFSYLSPYQVLLVGQVTNQDYFTHLIGTRFTELRVAELATDLITPNVLHEMAAKCPRLHALTLDFSTAMQLHDFTDLQNFPSRLRSLTVCLSENIFLEGFLRKVYTFISSVEVLHIIGHSESKPPPFGCLENAVPPSYSESFSLSLFLHRFRTYEKVEDEEEEVYETVNVHKLKQYMPNIRVVNLWGVPFITDDHVDAISSNCAHLECLCINYCTKVTGSCLRLVLQRCRKLRSLHLAHATLDDKVMQTIEWEKTRIEELNICGTELSSDTLKLIVTRLKNLTWLDASWLEDMNDQVVEAWMASESISNIKYLNLDTCDSLNEGSLTELVTRFGHQILGLNLGGHHKLLEYFWMNMIPKLRNVRVLVMGIAEDCCPKVIAKIHIDQFIDCIAQNCPHLCRLEIRWDDETLRFSDKSSKFIDVLRMKCLKLHSVVLSDGQYYELVRSNFERADRMSVVRTTEMCRTGLMHCSRYYSQLLFN